MTMLSDLAEKAQCPKCGNQDLAKMLTQIVQSEAPHASGRGKAWASLVGWKCAACGFVEKYADSKGDGR